MSRILESLAVVLPRYGESLGGGAEALVRALAERLIPANHGSGIVRNLEVWTTCALDHRTWENAISPGTSVDNGITVRRFPVDPRNLEVFVCCEHALQSGRPLSLDEQLAWLSESVNSKELYAHIVQNGHQFDAILFAPYLFATSFWGSLIYPEKSILLPCLHNESYAYLDVFHHQFHSVRGLLFNSASEMELACGLYGINDAEICSAVVGMGFDEPDGVLPRRTERVDEAPYLLYSGRKETGKNLDFLLECFGKYREQHPRSNVELRIIGSGEITFLNTLPGNVLDLGFVSENEKKHLMRNALALCQPSVNESFSIVLMEAWLERSPVLVHGDCAVTRRHAVDSGGGLFFTSPEEFSAVVNELVETPALALKLGESGYRYVRSVYNWVSVLGRFSDAMRRFGFSGPQRESHP